MTYMHILGTVYCVKLVCATWCMSVKGTPVEWSVLLYWCIPCAFKCYDIQCTVRHIPYKEGYIGFNLVWKIRNNCSEVWSANTEYFERILFTCDTLSIVPARKSVHSLFHIYMKISLKKINYSRIPTNSTTILSQNV